MIKKILKKLLISRKIHGFCLGAAKTGTTSVAKMFSRHYRSAHEPKVPELTLKTELLISKQLNEVQIIQWLHHRDNEMLLEMEASHPLGYFSTWLPQIFPKAKFIVTLRDPLVWLRSRLDFHKQKTPPEWQRYRDFIWGKGHKKYEPEENILQNLNLYSLDAYLSQYSEQYRIIFENIPESKRLIVNTQYLDESIEKIALFLNIDSSTIEQAHSNALANKEGIIDSLDKDFVQQKVKQHCGWLYSYL